MHVSVFSLICHNAGGTILTSLKVIVTTSVNTIIMYPSNCFSNFLRTTMEIRVHTLHRIQWRHVCWRYVSTLMSHSVFGRRILRLTLHFSFTFLWHSYYFWEHLVCIIFGGKTLSFIAVRPRNTFTAWIRYGSSAVFTYSDQIPWSRLPENKPSLSDWSSCLKQGSWWTGLRL